VLRVGHDDDHVGDGHVGAAPEQHARAIASSGEPAESE
jgi:hypothetical protein